MRTWRRERDRAEARVGVPDPGRPAVDGGGPTGGLGIGDDQPAGGPGGDADGQRVGAGGLVFGRREGLAGPAVAERVGRGREQDRASRIGVHEPGEQPIEVRRGRGCAGDDIRAGQGGRVGDQGPVMAIVFATGHDRAGHFGVGLVSE